MIYVTGESYNPFAVNESTVKWKAVQRWFERVAAAYADKSNCQEQIDFALVCLQECFSMRDWLKATGDLEAKDAWVRTKEYKVCRQVANAHKHCKLWPSDPERIFESDHMLAIEYEPDQGARPVLKLRNLGSLGRWTTYELFGLCKSSVGALEVIFSKHPFKPKI